MQPETQPHKLVIYITTEQERMIQQERSRLKQEYGLKVSRNELIQLLIEKHRVCLQTLAAETSDVRWWKYQTMVDEDD